jgi:hypothetical protein
MRVVLLEEDDIGVRLAWSMKASSWPTIRLSTTLR